MKQGIQENNREQDDQMRMVTSKHMLKLYAMSEEISLFQAKKSLEKIIKDKSESIIFEQEKNFNKDSTVRRPDQRNFRKFLIKNIVFQSIQRLLVNIHQNRDDTGNNQYQGDSQSEYPQTESESNMDIENDEYNNDDDNDNDNITDNDNQQYQLEQVREHIENELINQENDRHTDEENIDWNQVDPDNVNNDYEDWEDELDDEDNENGPL